MLGLKWGATAMSSPPGDHIPLHHRLAPHYIVKVQSTLACMLSTVSEGQVCHLVLSLLSKSVSTLTSADSIAQCMPQDVSYLSRGT